MKHSNHHELSNRHQQLIMILSQSNDWQTTGQLLTQAKLQTIRVSDITLRRDLSLLFSQGFIQKQGTRN